MLSPKIDRIKVLKISASWPLHDRSQNAASCKEQYWEQVSRAVTKFVFLLAREWFDQAPDRCNISAMKQEIFNQILTMMHTYGSRDCLKTIALQFPG